MAPIRSRKRKSDESVASSDDHEIHTDDEVQQIATKSGSPAAMENPTKKRRTGITPAQKQALIDNLQLEIAERARKLRANYNIHAQSLRTRVEIRVNRIPLSLRKVKMGDLLLKYSGEQHLQLQKAAPGSARGPPVPAKDTPKKDTQLLPPRPLTAPSVSPAHSIKRPSRDISGGDKENDHQQKKTRPGAPGQDIARHPSQVLSPASSNSRIAPRERAHTISTSPHKKSGIARPIPSPVKAGSSSSMAVDKARATGPRTTGGPVTGTGTGTMRKATTGSTTSTATRTRRAATTTSAPKPPSRAGTRTARRASGASESSEASTGTVVRKRPATAMATSRAGAVSSASNNPPGGTAKRTTMVGTLKKGVAGATTAGAGGTTKKPPTTSRPPLSASTGTGTSGRVLRKRAA